MVVVRERGLCRVPRGHFGGGIAAEIRWVWTVKVVGEKTKGREFPEEEPVCAKEQRGHP